MQAVEAFILSISHWLKAVDRSGEFYELPLAKASGN